MKFLIDMNLSPEWVVAFRAEGSEAVHWSKVGDPRAPDSTIMNWARENGFVVFTHDLDFGILLATGQHGGPSVVQVRTQDVMPGALGPKLFPALRTYARQIEAGALLTIDEVRARIRILPIGRQA